MSKRMDAAEQAAQDEALSVAARRPDVEMRKDGMRAVSPLEAFVRRHRLRHELYLAGCAYGEISRDAKAALCVPVPGKGRRGGAFAEEVRIAKEVLARRRYEDAIKAVGTRNAHDALEALCYVERGLSFFETLYAKSGLMLLAEHFGLIKHGINEGKKYNVDN